jgi:hypothetical protein
MTMAREEPSQEISDEPAYGPDVAPEIPAELGDLFLHADRYLWYIRWCGRGAYVGTTDRRKEGALCGLDIINFLLQFPCRDLSPAQLKEANWAAGDVVQTFGDYAEKNPGFGIETLGGSDLNREVKRHVESAEELIASQLPELGDYLRATILPPDGDDGVWSYDDRRGTVFEHSTRWTFGHVDDFTPPEYDIVFRRESDNEWYVRLGNDECNAPHSEGMQMLAVLLRYNGMPVTPEQLCTEVGIVKEQEVPHALAELLKRAEEFRPELNSQERGALEDEPLCDLPKAVPELVDALLSVVASLNEGAKNSYAEAALRGRGIPCPANGLLKGTFQELAAKMLRCEDLIAKLRTLEKVRRDDRPVTSVLQRRIGKSIRAAIAEIGGMNSNIGAGLKLHTKCTNSLPYIDLKAKP